jgi:hypothetical protein
MNSLLSTIHIRKGITILNQLDHLMPSNLSIYLKMLAIISCLLAVVTISACGPISREPGLSREPTDTQLPRTSTPTPPPRVEADNLSVHKDEEESSWLVFGTIRNISEDGLSDLELNVAVLDHEGETLAEGIFLPALRQLSPGDSTAFKAEFTQIDDASSPQKASVKLESFLVSTVTPLQITVDEISARSNTWDGTTYLGYFTNVQMEYGQIRNVEAFMMNEDGTPFDSAKRVVTLSSVAPRGRVPFSVEFNDNFAEAWPDFYIDAVPSEEPSRRSPLWTVAEPQLFLTSQGLPYYLLEIKNTAFAPQTIEGIFTLTKGTEIFAVLPIRSPAPIAAKSSWFFTLEPGLSLPFELRNDEQAISALIPNVTLDPIETRGVGDELIPIDLVIESVETIGGSIFFRGRVSNSTDQSLENPVVYATLRDPSGMAISANSERIVQAIPVGGSVDFTLSARIPAEIEPNALEFDLNAIALSASGSIQEGD